MEGQRNIGTLKEFQAEALLETFFTNSKLEESVKVAFKTAILSFHQHNRRELASKTASNIVAPEPKKRSPEINDIVAIDNSMTTARDKFLADYSDNKNAFLKNLRKALKKSSLNSNEINQKVIVYVDKSEQNTN